MHRDLGYVVTQGGLCIDNNSPAPPPRPSPPPSPPPPPPPPPANDPFPNRSSTTASIFPGSIQLSGTTDRNIELEASVVFVSANVSLVRLRALNQGTATVHTSFRFGGTATNLSLARSSSSATGVDFSLPGHPPGPCFDPEVFGKGGLRLASFHEVASTKHGRVQMTGGGIFAAQKWALSVGDSGGSFQAQSSPVQLIGGAVATTCKSRDAHLLFSQCQMHLRLCRTNVTHAVAGGGWLNVCCRCGGLCRGSTSKPADPSVLA